MPTRTREKRRGVKGEIKEGWTLFYVGAWIMQASPSKIMATPKLLRFDFTTRL